MTRRPTLYVALPTLLFLLWVLPVSPVEASEEEVMGSVVVEPGKTVDEDVSTVMGDVDVKGNVRGSVRSVVGDIRIDGPVKGDVEAGSGDVYVNNSVGGDVYAGQGNVSLGSDAQLDGDIFQGNGGYDRHPQAVLGGERLTGISSEFGRSSDDDDDGFGLFGLVRWFLGALGLVACCILAAVVAPRPLGSASRRLGIAPGRSFIYGVATLPVAVILAVVLAITVIGIPLLVLLIPAYLALVFFGALVVAYSLGRKIALHTGRYRAGDAVAAGLGALVVSAVFLIPYLGGLVFFVLALLGTGAAISALLARRWPAPPPTYASYEDYLEDRDG